MYSGRKTSLAMPYSISSALSCGKTLDAVQEIPEALKESAKKTKAAGGKKRK